MTSIFPGQKVRSKLVWSEDHKGNIVYPKLKVLNTINDIENIFGEFVEMQYITVRSNNNGCFTIPIGSVIEICESKKIRCGNN